MGSGDGPVVLPFRGNQFSFTLNCKGRPDEAAKADLAAIIFGRNGEVLDVVHSHKLSALMGAVCSGHDKSLWLEGCAPVPGDDVIHVMPKKLDPAAEAIVLVVSAPQTPGKVTELADAPKLEMVVTFTEPSDPGSESKVHKELRSAVLEMKQQGPVSSIVAAVAYLDQPGWTVRFDYAPSPFPSWSLMVPDLKAAVLRVKTQAGIPLDAALAIEAQQPDDTQILGFSRAYEDRSLSEAASFRLPEGATATVDKLRLDVAWKFWSREPEDEMEDVAVEFAIKFYDANGEEIQMAGSNDREVDGVVVGRPEVTEDEEEEEEQPQQEEEEEEGEEGEGESGEGEDGEPKQPPPPPPAPAEDPYEFKLRDVAFITISELPREVRSFVVLISNYEEAGFKPLKHAGIKLWDITNGEEGARPLVDFNHISKFEREEEVTQVVLLKVYKEYDNSAWNLWRTCARDTGAARTVQEWVLSQASNPGPLVEALRAAQVAHNELKAKEAAAEAEEEETGEESTEVLRTYTWRYSVPALTMGGSSMEDEAAEHDVAANLLNYDGPLKSLQARTYDCARVQFAGEVPDTFFGAYQDDLKHGQGVYCFATGAFYVGDFKGGKREGNGICLMPDGGLYQGELAKDRFHGQGQYRYPDGSVYTGSWADGKKDGPGVYWDTAKGCTRGSWSRGVLKGHAVYDQPALHYEGTFVQGVPAGPCTFTIATHRTFAMPKFAASHILDSGPTLRGPAEYSIPPGSGDDPELDEEGQPIEIDDKPPLPSSETGYEGMGFKSSELPESTEDMAFPPPVPVPIPDVPHFAVPQLGCPHFSMPGGITPPAAA